MNINPADTAPMKMAVFDKSHYVRMRNRPGLKHVLIVS